MALFEEKFQKACEDRYIPGAVVICGDSKGKVVYQKAFGSKTLKGDPPHPPLSVDDCFVLASCTKLMTSIAALQCVDRGQVGLDDDLSNVIPEFQNLDILSGFDDSGKPILKKAVKKITLRMLLTHTAGFTYSHGNPLMHKWIVYNYPEGQYTNLTMLEQMTIPLLFEPGTGWEYGINTDWAGIVVSRLNNNITLQTYLEKNVWQPLGITLMTFHPDEHPEVQKRLVGMTKRGTEKPVVLGFSAGNDDKIEHTEEALFPYPLAKEWGGAGGIGAPTDYIKILQSVLLNDGRLLSPGTVDEMFKPQLSPESLKSYELNIFDPAKRGFFASLPVGTPVQWGLGGRLVMDDLETGLRKGSMQWSGLPNLLWTIDRAAGLCMFYASNLVPFGDKKIQEYAKFFEKEMYGRFGQKAAV